MHILRKWLEIKKGQADGWPLNCDLESLSSIVLRRLEPQFWSIDGYSLELRHRRVNDLDQLRETNGIFNSPEIAGLPPYCPVVRSRPNVRPGMGLN